MTMYRLLVVAAVLAVAKSASLPVIVEPHIMGGHETTIETIPYQVSFRVFGYHLCGGVILAPNKILTAARCVYKSIDVNDYEIRAGSTLYKEGGQLIKVAKIVQHPQYEKYGYGYKFNVAVATLRQPIKFGPSAQSIAISREPPVIGEALQISGWGFNTYLNRRSEKILAAEVPVVDRKVCGEKVRPSTNITEDMFCAGGNMKSIYECDFGGPVTNSKRQLVGIGSFVTVGNVYSVPSVLVNLTNPAILNFITTNLN